MKRLLRRFIRPPKLISMTPDEAARILGAEVSHFAVSLMKNRNFLKASRYYQQDELKKGMYFNEIVASYLIMTEMLLRDRAMAGADYVYLRPIADKIYTSFWKILRDSGLDQEQITNWKKFVKVKGKNILKVRNTMRDQIIAEGKEKHRRLIEQPEHLIIRAAAYDTAYLLARSDFEEGTESTLVDYIIMKHLQVFLRLKQMV